MRKISLVMIFLLVVSSVGAVRLPGDGETDWDDNTDYGIENWLLETHKENGTIRNNIITKQMINMSETDFATNTGIKTIYYNKTEIDNSLANLANWDAAFSWGDHSLGGYLTAMTDSWESQTNALYLQPNKDSTARVRFFANTTGSPLISMYGYNPVEDSRPWMYLGMFDYTGVDGYMRTVLGASGGYDDVAAKMEIQSPYQVRITGVDSVLNVGTVRIAASKEITIHPETVAETDSAKHLIIDTTGGVTADGTDVELSTNAGDLVLNPAGDVDIKNGFTGTCADGTDLTLVNGIVTGCS